MESALTIIGTVIAVVASGVGVIAAVGQLTLRARLRRTVDLTTALIEQETDLERKTVLRSIRDVAVARLAAGWLLPWWRFTEATAWLVGGPTSLGWTITTQGWGGTSATGVFFNFVAVGMACRRGVRLYLERQRVARDYLIGAKMTPARVGLLEQMEGGVRAEFVVAALISAGTTLVAVGVGLFLHDRTFGWSVGLAVLGVAVAWSPSEWLRLRSVRPLQVEPKAPLTTP